MKLLDRAINVVSRAPCKGWLLQCMCRETMPGAISGFADSMEFFFYTFSPNIRHLVFSLMVLHISVAMRHELI